MSYDGQLLKYYADYEPETEACAHYTPYVDARDGFVYGRYVTVQPLANFFLTCCTACSDLMWVLGRYVTVQPLG